MIIKEDLELLGYRIHTELLNESIDFRHDRFPSINLSKEGMIQILLPVNSKETGKVFENLNTFKKYLSTYKKDETYGNNN